MSTDPDLTGTFERISDSVVAPGASTVIEEATRRGKQRRNAGIAAIALVLSGISVGSVFAFGDGTGSEVATGSLDGQSDPVSQQPDSSQARVEDGTEQGAALSGGQLCEPGPSPDAGVDETIDPDRRGEALVLHLTGIDELAVTEENEGEDRVYDDPNYGGVYGDFAGGWVVAVVDCSQVDADRIAEIAGGPDAVRLIEVDYSFEEINNFRDTLAGQLGNIDLPYGVGIDSTLNGREIVVIVEDAEQLPANFGEGVPEGVYKFERDPVFSNDPEPLDPDQLRQSLDPQSSIGALDCGEGTVIEDRLDNDGQEPIDIATSYSPDAVRVESLNALQWDAFDDNGQVVALLAIGDDDAKDWQVWTCG